MEEQYTEPGPPPDPIWGVMQSFVEKLYQNTRAEAARAYGGPTALTMKFIRARRPDDRRSGDRRGVERAPGNIEGVDNRRGSDRRRVERRQASLLP